MDLLSGGKPGGPDFGSIDTGLYMSGNWLSKGIDLLSTVNYGLAGAADAALQGRNPIAGVGEGIQNRSSFVDVLEHVGAPKSVSMIGGTIADVLTPSLPFAGALAKSAKGTARLAGVAKRMAGTNRTLAEVIEQGAKFGAEIASSTDEAIAGAHVASEVFNATGDTFRARVGARIARGAPEKAKGWARRLAQKMEPPHGSIGKEWMDATQATIERTLMPLRSHFENSTLFKGLGKEINAAFDIMMGTERALLGEFKVRADDILHGLGKEDWLDYNKLLRGIDTQAVYKPHVVEAVKKTKALTEETIEELQKRGVRQVYGAETQVIRRFSDKTQLEIKAAMDEVHGAAQHADDMKNMSQMDRLQNFVEIRDGRFLPKELWRELQKSSSGKVALKLAERGLHIDELGKVVGPIRKLENYGLPIIPKHPEKFNRLTDLDVEDIADLAGEDVKLHIRTLEDGYLEAIQAGDATVASKILEQLNDTGVTDEVLKGLQQSGARMTDDGIREAARRVAKRILTDRALDPNDVRRQLQHTRRGIVSLEDLENLDLDPRKMLYKFASDNANLLATSRAFGGDLSGYNALRKELATRHGFGEVWSGRGDRPPILKDADDTLDQAFKIATGRYHHPATPFVNTVSRAADHLMLGPRTLFLQLSTLANQAAFSGIANSMAGVAEALGDAPIRHLVERLAAHLPTMLDTAGDAKGLAKITSINPIMTGIGKMDRGMRVAAGVAAGLDVAAQEADILKLVKSGKMAAAEKKIAFLERWYGIDGSALRRGEELSDDLIGVAIQRGAHATNFTGDVLAVPKAMQGPVGKFMMKYKQYTLQQAGFINKLVNEGLTHGNYGPLLRYAGMFPWVYGDVLKLVNTLKSPERRHDQHEDSGQYLKDMLLIGAIGWVGDAAFALGHDSEALWLGLFAGPNASVIYKGAHAPLEALHGNLGTAISTLEPATIRQLRSTWAE